MERAAPSDAERKVLVLFAHPALHRSQTNRELIDGLGTPPGITVHHLYEAYPDLHIDVAVEQALLEQHEVIVLHFPLFWYSSPALVKEWQDLVLQHGWAYGRSGNALRGKRMMLAITTGGSAGAYGPEGHNRFTIRQLLSPFEATARMCGMRFLAPFVVHGTHLLDERARSRHVADYQRLMLALRDERIDWGRAEAVDHINHHLDALLRAEV